MRLGALVSGRGTNLRNLVEQGFEVVAVATNRPSCPAAAYARGARLPLGAFSQKDFASAAERDSAMAAWLLTQGVELVVAAGWDRVLSESFVRSFPDRILNVHPSLLPAFAGGMDAVAQALAHGVKVSGCTVHFADNEYDHGPIILQRTVPVLDDDTPDSLAARVFEQECEAYPEAIRLFADGRLRVEGRRVRVLRVK